MTGIIADVVIIAIVLIAVISAIRYICKEKKKGRPCIGCSSAGDCAKAKAGMACKK